MPSLRASLLARHAAHDAELTRRRHAVLADLNALVPAAPRSRRTAASAILTTLWRELFVAARPAWAALACAWLLLIGLAATEHGESLHTAADLDPATASARLAAWNERERAILALLAAPPPTVILAPPSGAPTSFLAPRRTPLKAV